MLADDLRHGIIIIREKIEYFHIFYIIVKRTTVSIS
jgi:hypothetical protein